MLSLRQFDDTPTDMFQTMVTLSYRDVSLHGEIVHPDNFAGCKKQCVENLKREAEARSLDMKIQVVAPEPTVDALKCSSIVSAVSYNRLCSI
jgi:hypothetical protein